MQAQALALGSRRGLEGRLAQVGQALESLDLGTYGDCHDCGEANGIRRLGARPEAPFCIAWQSNREP